MNQREIMKKLVLFIAIMAILSISANVSLINCRITENITNYGPTDLNNKVTVRVFENFKNIYSNNKNYRISK